MAGNTLIRPKVEYTAHPSGTPVIFPREHRQNHEKESGEEQPAMCTTTMIMYSASVITIVKSAYLRTSNVRV